MNEDMEKKLDQLLADMPKREYDLDAWLAEDETAEFDRIVSEQKRSEENATTGFAAKKKPLRRWIAAAACLIILIGMGVTLWPTEEQEHKPLMAQKTVQPKVKEAEPEKQKVEEVKAEPTKHVIARHQKQNGSENRPLTPLTPSPKKEWTREPSVDSDPNIHYAALSLTEDSVPHQDPARVDDFIAKLAEYHKVKAVPLPCTSDTGDSTVVSTAYLFTENQELDLFARLLQVACWYNTKTPGYLLNFSQKQFLFSLEDLRKGEKYLWMAERIGREQILLFSTRSPKNVTVSSACFQEYREQLTHIRIKTLNL